MKLLMNPYTGSIDTLENWKEDYKNRDQHEKNITWEKWSKDLIEVNEKGEEI